MSREGDRVVTRIVGEGDTGVTRNVGQKGDRVVIRIVGKPPTLTEIKSLWSSRPSLLNELSHRFEFIITRSE
jgi:hypothetical protein